MEIAADMLEAARKGARKTSIMYRANLSHALLQSYLGVLVGEELLNRSGEPERFHLSEKGSKLLRHLQELKRLHDQGLITDEEYEAKRRQTLDRL